MQILVISGQLPRPDLASGDLRFFTLLSLLASENDVLLCALDASGTVKPSGEAADRFVQIGVRLGQGSLYEVVQGFSPDIAWFEFFHQARPDYLRLLERHSPDARVVIDSVDVHFGRLESLAALTGAPKDLENAQHVRSRELAAYAGADMVIAVSEEDRRLLEREIAQLAVEVVPNVHAIPSYPDPMARRYGELIFVGGFRHDPNVDAVVYFCRDVLPIIAAARPDVRVKIVGSNAPPEVHALACEYVEVLGYVPDTAPYLERAYISIAPLRYGGGLKGKVGEAMSFGLPVVTTTFGAEGFGLVPGKDLLLGDTPQRFAEQVVALLEDPELHRRIGRSGYDFIAGHFSVPVVKQMLESSLQRLMRLPPRKAPFGQRVRNALRDVLARHLAWRLPQR